MDRSAALNVLDEIMHEILEDPAIQLTPQTTADDVEGWDSMVHITFLVEVEGRFGIKFQTTEISHLRDVGHLLDIIEARTAERTGTAVLSRHAV